MSNFNNLLNPKRKENLKFILSSAFVNDEGEPLEWEMRQLSASEGAEIARAGASNIKTITTMVANALVKPNLRNAEFLAELSRQRGRTILDPAEALMAIITDSELAKLILLYEVHNTVEVGKSTEAEK